ncbi:disease resistance protein RPS2-like [Mangifera indica]|uniref:disease resistance protein RPS2-like n=1 Tax=Mangifera indica TaxID=29780 RepID=UPI001CFC3AAE|nr:disease resistance protein RPS2-like [Mangifera indica]
MKEKIWNGQVPINFFGNLKSLVVDKFLDISIGISSNVLCCFKNLELLEVKSCESLEQVFDLEENHQEISGIEKLKSLKIDNCNSLRCIFTPAILLGLVQLQEIEVKNCALVEEIIKKEEKKDGVSDKIIIPQLNSVMLESLPSLTSFYSGRNILECPPLETIVIKDCQKVQMKEFNIHLAACFTKKVEIPTLGSSSCFQNLTILRIGGFDNLKYLFPSSMLKSFFKLKELEISNCMFMERVIDEDDGRTRTMLFPKLCQLKLRDLPKLTTFCNSTTSFVQMSSLFKLWIDNCRGIQTFISSFICGDMASSSKEPERMNAKEDSTHILSLFDKKVRLPSLEILEITYADQLVKLWDNQVSLDSFGKLIRVTVRFCKTLVSVFPSNMLGIHQKLEFLEVQNCDLVEEIFEVLEKSSVMVEEIVTNEETIPRLVFSELTWLNLQMLPSLKSFCPVKHISEWPDLEVLKVHGCNNVKIIASESLSIRGSNGDSQQTLFFVDKDAFPSLEELELCEMPRLLHLWRGNFQPCNAFQNLRTLKVSECGSLENSCFSMLSLQNLRTLQVSKCDGLIYLLTPSKAKTLNRLKRMNVSECKLMVEIMTHLGDEVVENSIVFGKLDCLELHCLPSLKSFCGGHYSLEFPFLEKVIVRKCLEMETFCHGVLSTPSLQRLQLTDGGEDAVEECWEGNLNSTMQYLFKNMNVQYSKED